MAHAHAGFGHRWWGRRDEPQRRDPGTPPPGRGSWAHRHRTLLRILLIVALVIIGLLVAARVALAPYATRYARRVLNETPGWGGALDGVDIALWRGAFTIQGLRIDTVNGEASSPMLSLPRLDVALSWKDLVHGDLRGRAIADDAVFTYDTSAKPPATPDDQATKDSKAAEQRAQGAHGDGGANASDVIWQEKIEKLMPIRVDHLEIHRATIRVVDRAKSVDVALSELGGAIDNLTNVADDKSRQPAKIDLKGGLAGGTLTVRGNADPLALQPTFDLKITMQGIQLPQLDPLLRAFAGIDVKQGSIDLYAETRSNHGALDGYLKPLVHDLDVVDVKRKAKEEGVVQAAKEAVVGAAAAVVKNHGKDQQATVIPISGRLDKPGTDAWATVRAALGNAFVRAIRPGFGGGGDDQGAKIEQRLQRERAADGLVPASATAE